MHEDNQINTKKSNKVCSFDSFNPKPALQNKPEPNPKFHVCCQARCCLKAVPKYEHWQKRIQINASWIRTRLALQAFVTYAQRNLSGFSSCVSAACRSSQTTESTKTHLISLQHRTGAAAEELRFGVFCVFWLEMKDHTHFFKLYDFGKYTDFLPVLWHQYLISVCFSSKQNSRRQNSQGGEMTNRKAN